ncbi:MAG: radical SAM protein [Oscillospiraceae bacterium]|nr:radical SAM protein [Oscillospiraceae bacterium]
MAEPRYPLLSLSRLRMGIDGPGVTTLIAGAGCPLRCRWCINEKLLREAPAEPVTARELYERVKIDDLYFRASGGGVCFGGGESLLHADFIRAFRALCPADWLICAETSLAVDPAAVRRAAEAVDRFIVDCKDWDEEIYRRYTGGDGARMKENLRLLLSLVGQERVTVRVPLIPQFNTPEHQARSAAALQALGVTQLDVFEYVIREP